MEQTKSMSGLSKTEEVLLSLIADSLFGISFYGEDNIDWDEVAKEALNQAVLPLAFYNMHCIPSDVEKKIKTKCSFVIAKNLVVNYNHGYVHEMLHSAKIPYVILKGCASARYYLHPTLRSMGDVDFLVNQTDLTQAGRCLENEGFAAWNEEHLCHIVYSRDDIDLEMHFSPSGVPNGKAGDIVKGYLSDILLSTQIVQTEMGEFAVPSDFHHGLVLLLHTGHHITGEGIGLRHLCDWAVFVNHFSEQSFVDTFEDKLQSVGLWRFAQILTQLSIVYLGLPKKEWAMQDVDYDLLNAMIQDVFDGGNFGHKDAQRSNEAYLISSRGKSGVGNKTMFLQALISVNEAVKVHFPPCRRNILLLPLGWIIVCTKQLILIAKGKRKRLDPAKMINDSTKRRAIYKEFHLYEV